MRVREVGGSRIHCMNEQMSMLRVAGVVLGAGEQAWTNPFSRAVAAAVAAAAAAAAAAVAVVAVVAAVAATTTTITTIT